MYTYAKATIASSAATTTLGLPACGGDDDGDGDGTGDAPGTPDAADVETPALTVTSDRSQIRVRREQSIDLKVNIERQGGLEGTVDISIDGLPSGVIADPKTIAASATSATLVIEALNSAAHGGPSPVTITATSSDDPSVTATLSLPTIVAGAPGDLDESFSTDGIVQVTPAGADDTTYLESAIVDNEGRYVLSGFSVADPDDVGWLIRLLPDGSLDSSFDDDGRLVGLGSTDESQGRSLLATGDGGFFHTFYTRVDVTTTHKFRKYLSTGAVDPAFGVGGTALLSDSRSLIGFLGDGILTRPLELYDTAGTLDSSFTAAAAPAGQNRYGIAIDSDERIVISYGSAVDNDTTDLFVVGRLTSSGAIDTSFGDGGLATFPVPPASTSQTLASVVVAPDGSGYAVGTSSTGTDIGCYVVAFDSSGAAVTTFGTEGMLLASAGGNCGDALLEPSGALLILRIDNWLSTKDRALARYSPDGSIDTTFGTDGLVPVPSSGQLLHDPAAGRVTFLSRSGTGTLVVHRYWL